MLTCFVLEGGGGSSAMPSTSGPGDDKLLGCLVLKELGQKVCEIRLTMTVDGSWCSERCYSAAHRGQSTNPTCLSTTRQQRDTRYYKEYDDARTCPIRSVLY